VIYMSSGRDELSGQTTPEEMSFQDRPLLMIQPRPSDGGTLSAQYVLNHIFVYRRDQNLPYKLSDV
jgi:hypothetical protein